MISKIHLLKILTAVSFLFVIISGEKLSFFIGIYLLIAIFNPYLVSDSIYSYIISAFVLYLYISGNVKKNAWFDDIVSAISIIAMQVFIYAMIDFRYIRTKNIITLSVFVILSCTALGLIIYRRIKSPSKNTGAFTGQSIKPNKSGL